MTETLNGFAIDLGGTKIAAARFEREQIVARARSSTDGAAGLPEQLDTIAALLDEIGYTASAPLGVAVAGRIVQGGVWSAVNSETLTSISATPLGDGLHDRFAADAVVMNDAVAAAVGEAQAGAGRGAARMLYLTVSTGVGGALVLGGQPVTSPDGVAGHIGLTTARGGEDRCGSGRWGTVESVASGKAISEAARRAGRAETSPAEIFALARRGEEWAEALLMRSAKAVAGLIGDMRAVAGIERVVIGGGVGLAPGYLDRVQAALEDEPPLFRAELTGAALGADSALFGVLGTLPHRPEEESK